MNKIKEKKFIINSYFFIFIYIILEGGIRKWFFPTFNIEIIVIRDIFVILLILYGFSKRIFFINSSIESISIFWTFLIIFWSILQIIIKNTQLGIIIVGYRNWILYLWIAILFYRSIDNYSEIERFLFKISLILIPMSFIVILQHFLPIDHFINQYTQDTIQLSNKREVSQVIPGIVRTTGTFTNPTGYGVFTIFITPIILSILDFNTYKNRYFKLKFFIIISFVICIVVSGSRTVIFSTLFLSLMYYLILICFKKFKKVFLFSIIFLIFYLLSIIFLDRAIDAIIQRIDTASVNEKLSVRMYELIFGNIWQQRDFDFLGIGFGYGSNLSKIFVREGFILGEYETDRIIGEGGLIGFLFIFFKLMISYYLLRKSLQISLKKDNYLPIIFSLAFISIILIQLVTGQNTVHAFSFLCFGLSLALVKIYDNQKNY
tara:strand:+ start:2738 stop:4033 length:1296 start_codon:yes stop_codon:yes gene_type:complete